MFNENERAQELRAIADKILSPLTPVEYINKEHLGKPIALLCRTLADLIETPAKKSSKDA